jgi:hypothetical protein
MDTKYMNCVEHLKKLRIVPMKLFSNWDIHLAQNEDLSSLNYEIIGNCL